MTSFNVQELLNYRQHINDDPKYVLGGGKPTLQEVLYVYYRYIYSDEGAQKMVQLYIDGLHKEFAQ